MSTRGIISNGGVSPLIRTAGASVPFAATMPAVNASSAEVSSTSQQMPHEDDLLPLTASYESICGIFRKEFPNLSVIEKGYLGPNDGRTFHGPAIGVAYDNLRGALIAGHGQRRFPDSNFVIVPPSTENLFVEGGRLYTGSAIRLQWSEERLVIGCETYSSPLELGMLICFGSFHVDEKILMENGISMLNASPVMQLANDKARFKEVASARGIATPRFKNVAGSEVASREDAAALIRAFLGENASKGFVVKPNNKSSGVGVRLFKAVEIDVAAEYLVEALQKYGTMLIEERIDSRPYYIDGKRIDWNLRVMVSDISEGWDLHATSEARCDEYNGSPVNKCTGAKVVEVGEVFDRVGLSQDERSKLESEMRRISKAIKESLHRALVADNGGVDMFDARGRSYFDPLFLGLDLIIDENLNVHCIEVNAGHVGGIESLAELRVGEGKYRSIQELVRSAHAIAAADRRASEGEGRGDSAARRYVVSDDSFTELAGLYYAHHSYDKAIEYYLEALKREPEESILWYNLGNAYSDKGDIDKAILLYERALELDPKYAAAWNNLGNAYSDKGDIDKTTWSYEKALALDPKLAAAWNNLGNVYYAKGDIDKAISLYEKALEFDPKDAVVWNNLGNVYYAKGDIDRARTCREKAAALSRTAA